MATFDQVETRLTTLLRRNRRNTRVAAALRGWASLGVVASALEPRGQEKLLKAFRAENGVSRTVKAPVEKTLRDFATTVEIAIVIGYGIDEEPALLVPAASVARLHGKLPTLYPDGLLVADQPLSQVLVLDFGEGQDVDIEEVTFPRS
jgi:hypothetical protein